MTPEDLEKRYKAGKAPLLLDVRSGLEFESGHISGAVHAPVFNVLKAVQVASSAKQDLLVLVCEHGPRAQLAKALLKWNGYKNIELLDGHMTHWRSSGRSVVEEG